MRNLILLSILIIGLSSCGSTQTFTTSLKVEKDSLPYTQDELYVKTQLHLVDIEEWSSYKEISRYEDRKSGYIKIKYQIPTNYPSYQNEAYFLLSTSYITATIHAQDSSLSIKAISDTPIFIRNEYDEAEKEYYKDKVNKTLHRRINSMANTVINIE